MKHLFNSTLVLVCFFLTVPVSAQETANRSTTSVAPAAPASKAHKSGQSLRILLKTGVKKTYVRGYQWMALDLNRKISLIETARRGAVQMNAVMTLPAETYVAGVNKFYQDNPSLQQMELGQVIQGIAISLKDWDNGGIQK